MPSPFPGMDPYLERPGIWPSVHHSLVVHAADEIQPLLLPRYVACIEVRSYLEPSQREHIHRGARVPPPAPASPHHGTSVPREPEWIPSEPGLEIREGYVEIRALPGNELVTVIEILRPANKVPGPGRDAYCTKQGEVLLSTANLVEIDLLRAGWPTVAAPPDAVREGEYLICTRRLQRPGGFEVVRFGVRDPLPPVAIPLRPGEPDVVLDLAGVFARCYDAGAYAYRVDYSQPPDPPLSPEDAAWAEDLLRGRAKGPGVQ